MSFELNVVVKTTIIFLFVTLVSIALRRASASARHAAWALGLLAVLAFPLVSRLLPSIDLPILPAPSVESDLPVRGLPSQSHVGVDPAQPKSIDRLEAHVSAPAVKPSTEAIQSVTSAYWVSLIWGLGSCVVFVGWIVALLQLRKLKLQSKPLVGEAWTEVLAEVQHELSVIESVQLRISAIPVPPMTWGIFHHVILLPVSALDWSPVRRRLVIAHEMAHVKRNDGLGQILAQAVCSIYWFNPLAWYAVHRLQTERERACDDTVLRLGAPAEDYADHLVQIARGLSSGFVLTAVSMAHPSQLKSRVVAILDLTTKRRRLSRLAAAALLAVIGLLTMSVAAIQLTALSSMAIPSLSMLAYAPSEPARQAPQPQAPVASQALSNTPPLQGLAAVRGMVVKLGTSEPLPGTRVELTRIPTAGTVSSAVTTSDDGGFAFSNVQPGEYRLIASRADGYLAAEYGQRHPNLPGQPITLGPNQWMKEVALAMAPPASIAGRVLDRNGQPAGRIQVQALRTSYRDGRRSSIIVQSVLTNDLGEYRLFWMPPGQFIVTAIPTIIDRPLGSLFVRRPDEGTELREAADPVISRRVSESGEVIEEVYLPVYLPGTTDAARASIIDLHPGDNITGRQIALPAPVRSRHIHGSVINGATGQVAAGTHVIAIARNSGPRAVESSAMADKNGAFDISGVVSGSYDLFAINPGTGGIPSGGGRVLVEVAADDVQNVSITIPIPFDIAGKLTVEGDTTQDLSRIRIGIMRDPDIIGMPFAQPSGSGTAEVAPGSTFKIANVGAGDYRILITLFGVRSTNLINLPQGMYLKSMRVGNVDVLTSGLHLDRKLDSPLEIVLGTNAPSVNGTVVNEKREPVGNSVVSLVPDSSLRARIDLYKSIATDALGHFTLSGVVPGDYKLFAWDQVENSAWMDQEFIRSFENRGTAIRLSEGSNVDAQPTMIAVPRQPQ